MGGGGGVGSSHFKHRCSSSCPGDMVGLVNTAKQANGLYFCLQCLFRGECTLSAQTRKLQKKKVENRVQSRWEAGGVEWATLCIQRPPFKNWTLIWSSCQRVWPPFSSSPVLPYMSAHNIMSRKNANSIKTEQLFFCFACLLLDLYLIILPAIYSLPSCISVPSYFSVPLLSVLCISSTYFRCFSFLA